MISRISNPRNSRGVALITALLILTIATTAAVYLARQEHLSIRRSANVINGNQAYLYALGGETLAMTVLFEDRRENNTDGYTDTWAFPMPPYNAEGFMILGEITDLQSRFNINNLVNENDTQDGASIDRFRKLIMQYGIDPNAVNAVIDWLDRNIAPSGPDGAEDDYYLGLDPPYRAANGPMHSVSELRLVKGFNVDTFNQLAKSLTAIPEHVPVNLNTAPVEFWIALGAEPARAEEVARQRIAFSGEGDDQSDGRGGNGGDAEGESPLDQVDPEKVQAAEPFESVGEALRQAGLNPEEVDTRNLSVTTDYFLFEAEVFGDRSRAVLKSVLHRNKKGIMRVVMRSQGGL